MTEEEKNLSPEEETEVILEAEEPEAPQEEVKVKTPWQMQKESWYDKIPLNVKQLDIIIAVCWILLALTFVCIFLEAKGIIRLFG